ncbi:MAG: PAS domain S-box protein, partial [Candidatus Bathyarchaeia archaeon]
MNFQVGKDITERKKTEEALAASEQKYRTIVETAAEGIVIAKPDGTHTFVNDRLAQMFGYTTEELLRKSSFELMAKEEQRRQALQVRKSLEKKQVLYSEFEFCRKDGSILWAACNSSPLFDENGKHVANISMFSDITERKKTEEALKKSEAEYSSLFANMIDGFAHCQMIFDDAGEPVDFVYLQVNDAYEKITGLKRQVVVGKKVTQLIPGIRATNPEIFEIYGKVALTGQKEKFVYFLQPLGLWLSVSAYCPARGYFAAVFEDVTERKKAENEREIMVEFLRIANAATCSHDLIEGALDFFQKQCGCEAVGIRLKEGDDYPYYETKGFPVKHVKLENKLCKSDESGYVIRDSKGRPVLECMCGNVICGRFDSSKKFFTENGSFWTNSTTQLLASTISADRQGTTRNRCNSEGYESVALIALRIGETRLGLLQLNDKRKDMFTLETVQMWERIADRLALALSRNIAEEALREDEVKFRTVADFAYNWEYWIGPDGNMIYVSPSSKRITSYDANEFIKDPELLTKIVYPEDKPIVGPHFDMISSDELHAVDFRIVTRDGKIRWVSHTCKAVFDDNGKWIGRRASNRDITLRKKIEQRLSITLEESQLRQSEISALLKASRAVLHHQEFPDSARAIFDACKELIGATAGYVALLSDTGKENEVLFLDSGGLPCTVDPSLPMPIRGLRGEVYGTGKVAIENNFPESEWQKFSPKGHVLLENVMFAPLTIERRTVGVIGLANKPGGFTKRDAEMAKAFGEIASVALVNSKMLEYSEHLEALVEERTQKLRDSERLAAIGETAGMVGHDIRNPLQSITGELYLARTSLESLPDNNVKEEIRESIGYIEEQLLYVNKIVLDLQDFAKAAKPQLQEVDLEKTLQNVLSAMNIPE